MKDYIEREQAITVFKTFYGKSLRVVLDALREEHAADVREVVYCKDCVHFVRGKLFGDMVCDYHCLHQYHAEPNEYCSHGEKREES